MIIKHEKDWKRRSDGGKKSDGIKIYECVQRRLTPLRKVVRVTSLINGLLTAWRMVAREEEQRWRIRVLYFLESTSVRGTRGWEK